MNEMLQETLKEQATLTLQIKTLEDEVQTLRRELQTTQNEAAKKTKDLDVLRNYFRRSEQTRSKKERDVRETEAAMEKVLEMKDSMICRYTHQIEELQNKVKRIPQLASQLSRLESLNATLSSTFTRKEKEMGDHSAKLESALMVLETKFMTMESQYERKIAEVKDALKQEKRRTIKRAAEVQTENAKLEQVIKHSKDSHKALEEEKRTLEERISQLEKVRAEQRSILGIVFSVDLSASLIGASQLLAKDAFRELINGLRSKSPKAHVGVVVHASSIYVARQMTEVDLLTSTVLDSITCGGSEDYFPAFTHIVSLLSIFKDSYPGAKRRVIMISDGEGYSPLVDVSTLSADGVPCHNIVVGNSCYPNSTEKCSSITGGKNFKYNGSYGIGDIDVLIGP